MTRTSLLFFFGLLTHAAGGSVPSRFLNRSLAFEPNRGQAAPSVLFVGRGNSYDYLLNGSGVTVLGATLRFSAANPEPQALALDPLAERHNYFRSPASQTDVPTYRRVRYNRIYPGIDCVFYGDHNGLEFDFEVSPSADPGKIRLRWSAAKRIRLAGNGELVIETASGDLRQRKPTVYQEHDGKRTPVEGGYVLAADGEIHFSLGRYDRTLPLIIDPVLFALDESVISIAAMAGDPAGNVYITGSTSTSVLPTSAGVVQPVYGAGTCILSSDEGPPASYPCPEAFVIKLDSTGQIVYATYVGGAGAGIAIAVDSAGDAYVAGTTAAYTSNFPITPNAAFPKPGGKSTDGFITKFNPTGSQLLYSTYVPNLPLSRMALDGQGNAYFAGTLAPGLSFPVTAGAFQTSTSNSTSAGVVGKFNAAGSALIYGTYLGESANFVGGLATGIAVDASGAAYVTGASDSTNFPTTPGAFQTKLPDPVGSAYVAKIAPSGASLIYSTFLGSGGGYSVRVDPQGNAIVLGTTGSAQFPATPNAFQPAGPGAPWFPSGGQFLSKLNPAGSALVYSTYIAGGSALDIDSAGNAYVVGAASYGFPTTAGAFQACSHGGETDIIAAEFAPDGKLLGATYLGGSSFDGALAVVALGSGSINLAGTTTSPDFPGVVGATNLAFVENLLIDDPNRPNGPCLAFTIQNAATFVEGPIAPGEIVTLRGKGIGPEKPVSGMIGADGNVTTELAGVTVLFGDLNIPAPLLYVQSEQINAVVPWGVGGDSNLVAVQVLYNGIASTSDGWNVAVPGIFLTDYSTGQAAALNADGTPNSQKNPAKRGSVIAFYGTGGGLTDVPGVDGGIWPSSPLAHLAYPVSVTIGNADAEVLYSGSAPGMVSGIFQINVRVPDSVSGSGNSIVVTVNGISSPPSTAYLAVE
jgi:uncharacterized protein (TIGR03437 family)